MSDIKNLSEDSRTHDAGNGSDSLTENHVLNSHRCFVYRHPAMSTAHVDQSLILDRSGRILLWSGFR